MANPEHLEILKQGVEVWNEWQRKNFLTRPDLRGANLRNADLLEANLRYADLREADLTGADLMGADLKEAQLGEADLQDVNLGEANLKAADLQDAKLKGAHLRQARLQGTKLLKADLQGADLTEADLSEADLSEANLERADLWRANLKRAKLSGANLSGADLWGSNLASADLEGANLTRTNLSETILIKTNLDKANLTSSRVYGISAWDLALSETIQRNLIITPDGEPTITVDNIEVAQFIYLLLYNEKIRQVINTITSKVVLILGRFTEERKVVLEAIREELRRHDLLPVLFDFDKPATRDIHETVTTLARMARFVIADITDPKSIPQELVSIVEQLPSLPVQPILQEGFEPWGMYDHIQRYPWVLKKHRYKSLNDLLVSLKDKVITPAELKAKELTGR